MKYHQDQITSEPMTAYIEPKDICEDLTCRNCVYEANSPTKLKEHLLVDHGQKETVKEVNIEEQISDVMTEQTTLRFQCR